MASPNERKLCDAIARIIEVRTNSARTNSIVPERLGHKAPIDYAFQIQNQTYAFEHTSVEAFEGQIGNGKNIETFLSPIREALDGAVPPPGIYYLNIPFETLVGVKRKTWPQIQRTIIQWARDTAAEFHEAAPSRRTRSECPGGVEQSARTTIEGVPVLLRREVHWSTGARFDGRLFPGAYVPKDYGNGRALRIARALDDKCPKLHYWKQQGATTILILENADVALSNHMLIGESLISSISQRNDIPDEVFLADTCIEKEWTIWSLFRANTPWPDEETNTRYKEFDPIQLNAV
jgi:hypothetical protein